MTGVATRTADRVDERSGAYPPPGPPGRRAADGTEGAGSTPGVRSRIGIELALFAAIGALGVLQWSRLVADPGVGRLLLALAIVTAGGAAMAPCGRRAGGCPTPGWPRSRSPSWRPPRRPSWSGCRRGSLHPRTGPS